MRYDLRVRVVEGPGKGQELRGKGTGSLVPIGKQPARGGIALPVRHLAPHHATAELRDGQAILGPVGTHPVRLAEHAQVDWSRIDPLTAPAWWNPGGVAYLGRPGHGVALELIEVEALGDWQGADRVSPDAPARILPPRLPLVAVGFAGIGVTLAMGVALIIVIIALWEPVEIAPVAGEVTYDFADPEDSRLVSGEEVEALERAWSLLVVQRSADAAEALDRDMNLRRHKDAWDRRAFRHFVASAEKHAGSLDFYRRVEGIRGSWAKVRTRVTEAGLPGVLAAIPMTESRYRPRVQSVVCARGFWQFMPETAIRVGVRVTDCPIRRDDGSFGTWSPSAMAPPLDPPYLDRRTGDPQCRLRDCRIDERTDLDASTAGAIRALSEPWSDPDLAASGAAVLLTILSHNAGYDDSLHGAPRVTNIRPAYLDWKQAQSPDRWHLFYGDNLTCTGPEAHADLKACGGSALAGQTQHYGYTVVAQYLVAMCYLGRNHGDDFPDWFDLAREDDGPCSRFRVPGPNEVD